MLYFSLFVRFCVRPHNFLLFFLLSSFYSLLSSVLFAVEYALLLSCMEKLWSNVYKFLFSNHLRDTCWWSHISFNQPVRDLFSFAHDNYTRFTFVINVNWWSSVHVCMLIANESISENRNEARDKWPSQINTLSTKSRQIVRKHCLRRLLVVIFSFARTVRKTTCLQQS